MMLIALIALLVQALPWYCAVRFFGDIPSMSSTLSTVSIPLVVTSILCFVLFALLCLTCYVIMDLYRRQVEFEDELEERVDASLRILDRCYTDVATIASKPVFFDSPEVRAVVAAIKRSRDAILYVIETLNDIEIEDKSSDVDLEDVKFVGDDDTQPPTSATSKNDEELANAINAVKSGRADVINADDLSTERRYDMNAGTNAQQTTADPRAVNAVFASLKKIDASRNRNHSNDT